MSKIILPIIFFIILSSCFSNRKRTQPDLNLEKAIITLNSLYRYYDVGENNLLYTFPLGNNIVSNTDAQKDQTSKSRNGDNFKLIRKGNVWSVAVLLRGYAELFYADGNSLYIDDFNDNLAHAWLYTHDEDGLFDTDWSGFDNKPIKWLLTEAAIIEKMYARMEKIRRTE